MKHKTAELTNERLDAAVALAEGYKVAQEDFGGGNKGRWLEQAPDGRWNLVRSTSTDWELGGPIIYRKRITIGWSGEDCVATAVGLVGMRTALGQDPLVAGMRAYAASELGDEVDL